MFGQIAVTNMVDKETIYDVLTWEERDILRKQYLKIDIELNRPDKNTLQLTNSEPMHIITKSTNISVEMFY